MLIPDPLQDDFDWIRFVHNTFRRTTVLQSGSFGQRQSDKSGHFFKQLEIRIDFRVPKLFVREILHQ